MFVLEVTLFDTNEGIHWDTPAAFTRTASPDRLELIREVRNEIYDYIKEKKFPLGYTPQKYLTLEELDRCWSDVNEGNADAFLKSLDDGPFQVMIFEVRLLSHSS